MAVKMGVGENVWEERELWGLKKERVWTDIPTTTCRTQRGRK